jgi:hypothetical protein
MLALIFVSTFGWWTTRRKLTSLEAHNTRIWMREMNEVLPEIAQSAWVSMHDTFYSISIYPPFVNTSQDEDMEFYNQLGKKYRNSLDEVQRKWIKTFEENQLSPLEFAKAALTSYDEVLEKYRTEIDQAHNLMMKRYEGKAMPRRNQDGFNWVKIW